MMNTVQKLSVTPFAAPKGAGMVVHDAWPDPQDFAALLDQHSVVANEGRAANLLSSVAKLGSEAASTGPKLLARPASGGVAHHHVRHITLTSAAVPNPTLQPRPEAVEIPPFEPVLTLLADDSAYLQPTEPRFPQLQLPQVLPLPRSKTNPTQMDEGHSWKSIASPTESDALPPCAYSLMFGDYNFLDLVERRSPWSAKSLHPAQKLLESSATPTVAKSLVADVTDRTIRPLPATIGAAFDQKGPESGVVEQINQASGTANPLITTISLAPSSIQQSLSVEADALHIGGNGATVSPASRPLTHSTQRAEMISFQQVARDQVTIGVHMANFASPAKPDVTAAQDHPVCLTAHPTDSTTDTADAAIAGQNLRVAQQDDNLPLTIPLAPQAFAPANPAYAPLSALHITIHPGPKIAASANPASAPPDANQTPLSSQTNPLPASAPLTALHCTMTTLHGPPTSAQPLSRFQHLVVHNTPSKTAQIEVSTASTATPHTALDVEAVARSVETPNTVLPSAILPKSRSGYVEVAVNTEELPIVRPAAPLPFAVPIAQTSERLSIAPLRGIAPHAASMTQSVAASPSPSTINPAINNLASPIPIPRSPAHNPATSPTAWPSAPEPPLATKRLSLGQTVASLQPAIGAETQPIGPPQSPAQAGDPMLAAKPTHEIPSAITQADAIQPLLSDAAQPPPVVHMPAIPEHSTFTAPDHAIPILPKGFPAALAHSVTTSGHSRAELFLEPAELGRMRFELVTQGDQVQINLTAERPETLALLRRHAEELRQEFRASGLDTGTLNFSQWGQQAKDQPREPLADTTDLPLISPPAPLSAPQTRAIGAGLDLRL